MRPRTLLTLAILVAVLAGFIWFFERELPSTEERADLAKRVLTVEAESIDSIVIEREGQTVELRRSSPADGGGEAADLDEESSWQLQRPLQARADGAAVGALVTRLGEIEKVRILEAVDRADVGLDSPRARVVLGSPAGEDVLQIGAEIPASSNMTLAVEGRDEVYVVGSSVWNDLSKPPGDWRDKNLFAAARDDIDRITLRRADDSVLLGRRGEQFWVEAPRADRADEDAIGSLLTEIAGLRAESFVDAPQATPAEMGLETPLGELEVVVRGDQQPFRFELGSSIETSGEGEEAPPRYARIGEQIVTVRSTLTESLERSVDDWRSREWASSEVYRIDRALIEDAEGSTEIRRDAGDWLRDGEKIDFGPATDLLFEVTGARAERLVDDVPDDLGEPALTVMMSSEDGTEETVWLYAPRDGEVPARVSDRETVLMLSSETADNVLEKLTDLRSAEPQSTEPPPGDAATEDA